PLPTAPGLRRECDRETPFRAPAPPLVRHPRPCVSPATHRQCRRPRQLSHTPHAPHASAGLVTLSPDSPAQGTHVSTAFLSASAWPRQWVDCYEENRRPPSFFSRLRRIRRPHPTPSGLFIGFLGFAALPQLAQRTLLVAQRHDGIDLKRAACRNIARQ